MSTLPGPCRRELSADKKQFGHRAEEGEHLKRCSVCGRPLMLSATGMLIHERHEIPEARKNNL